MSAAPDSTPADILDAHAHALAVVAASYRVAATLLRADGEAAADQVMHEVATILGPSQSPPAVAYSDGVQPAGVAAVRAQLAMLRRDPDAPVVVRVERRHVEHHPLAPMGRRPPKDPA